jgi:hypothetical protein
LKTGISIRALPLPLRRVARDIERTVRADAGLCATVESGDVLTPKVLAEMRRRLASEPGSLPFTASDLESIAKYLPKPGGATTPRHRPAGTMSPIGTRFPGAFAAKTGSTTGTGGAAVTADRSGDLTRLNDTQRAVVADVFKKAAERSDAAMAALTTRFEQAGLTKADLELTLDYVKTKAPLLVAFHPDKELRQEVLSENLTDKVPTYSVAVDRANNRLIDALLKDGTYRNQFETGISGGSPTAYPGGLRDGYEAKVFEGGYHTHELIPQERPKYGSLYAGQIPSNSQRSYGSCYLVLKPGVRDRTTFTPADSALVPPEMVGTADAFAHVLANASKDVFKDLVQAATTKNPPTTRAWSYIEAQVHGPIDFATDVARLVADVKFKGTPYEDKLRAFAEHNGIALQWHSDEKVWSDDVA